MNLPASRQLEPLTLTPARTPRLASRAGLLVFAVYLALQLLLLRIYQPWEDEGRGWMIARSFSVPTLLSKTLRYEGHPPLWYLLLWLPAHLGAPFRIINWIAAAIAVAGIALLLRHAPFPLALRALLPFGFYLGYQYAIVARSYVLFPLLVFLTVHLLRKPAGNPLALAVALALLANVSIHGAIVAVGFALHYVLTLRTRLVPAPRRNPLLQAATLFAVSIVFVVACIWPPHHLKTPFSANLNRLFDHIETAHAPRLKLIADEPPPPIPNAQPDSRLTTRLTTRLLHIAAYPVSRSAPLALVFEALTLVYLYRRRCLSLAIPPLLLVAFLLTVFEKNWHVGMVWVTLVAVLWAAWEPTNPPPTPSSKRPGLTLTFNHAFTFLFGAVCLLQVPDTLAAVRNCLVHPTYPAGAAAEYLKQRLRQHPAFAVATSGLGFTLEPYFPHGVFSLYAAHPAQLVAALPPILITDQKNLAPADVFALAHANYRQTRQFCGAPWFPRQPPKTVCLLFYETP